jgi:hypothetical protein
VAPGKKPCRRWRSMGCMRPRIVAVLACLAVAAVAKPEPPTGGIRWARDWSAAVEEARALNLPLIVHRHGFY